MELSIKGLTKQFKDKTAVDHVDLTVTPGVCICDQPSADQDAGSKCGSGYRDRTGDGGADRGGRTELL